MTTSKEVKLQETIGFQIAMSFKPFIDPKCSEHMEIVKDMAKTINSAYDNSAAFHKGYDEGKKQAVNERQRLIDSNRELTEILDYILGSFCLEKCERYDLHEKAKTAINNAKNIQP